MLTRGRRELTSSLARRPPTNTDHLTIRQAQRTRSKLTSRTETISLTSYPLLDSYKSILPPPRRPPVPPARAQDGDVHVATVTSSSALPMQASCTKPDRKLTNTPVSALDGREGRQSSTRARQTTDLVRVRRLCPPKLHGSQSGNLVSAPTQGLEGICESVRVVLLECWPTDERCPIVSAYVPASRRPSLEGLTRLTMTIDITQPETQLIVHRTQHTSVFLEHLVRGSEASPASDQVRRLDKPDRQASGRARREELGAG